MLYTNEAPVLEDLLLELSDTDERELLSAMLDEDLLEDNRLALFALDELLLEGGKLELDANGLDEALLDTGAADELVAMVPHAPNSLQAFVHAQPTPGS